VSHVSEEAIVLRTYPLAEADRIVILLTKNSGKVRAIAKGIRRQKSKFGGRLELGSRVHVVVWRGRSELGVIQQVQLLDGFATIRADLDRITASMAVLEVADQLVQDDLEDNVLFSMVGNVLATLNDPSMHPQLVAPAFFLKALVADGAGPVVDCCVSCGASGALVAFAASEGGVLCGDCRRGRPISPQALQLLQRILTGGLRGVLLEPASGAASEVSTLATEAIEQYLDRRLKSVRSAASW
jgi:DNA repair protein RecO (recombination protein O)